MYNNLKPFDRSWLYGLIVLCFPDANCKKFYNGNIVESNPSAKYSIIFIKEYVTDDDSSNEESNIFKLNYFKFNQDTEFSDYYENQLSNMNFLSHYYYNFDQDYNNTTNFKNIYNSISGSDWPEYDDYIQRKNTSKIILQEIDNFYRQSVEFISAQQHNQLVEQYLNTKLNFEKTKKLIDTINKDRDIVVVDNQLVYNFFSKNNYKCVLLEIDHAVMSECISLNLIDYKKHFRKTASNKKNYFCLNRCPRKQRIKLIETLNYYNLISTGHVTDNSNVFGLKAKVEYPGVIYNKNDLSHYVRTEQHIYPDNHSSIDSIPCSSNVKNFKFIAARIPGLVKVTAETDLKNLHINSFTEKSLIGFVTCRIPIIAGNYKIIEFFRRQGFDMFDDIIDHSYDNVVSDNERIRTLVSKNKDVLKFGVDATTDIVNRLHCNQDYLINEWSNKSIEKLINDIKNLK